METMNELALFAGVGGGILGGKLLGWRTVCAVEIDPYARAILAARQNDKTLEPFPIWDDVCSFDGRPWRGIVDVVSGGFPCQDISSAGRGAGIAGAKSGLWKEMARIIGEVRPRFAFVENSPMLVTRGIGVVVGDLAEMGYDSRWGIVSAAEVGAPHLRKRIWIVANADQAAESSSLADAESERLSSGGREQKESKPTKCREVEFDGNDSDPNGVRHGSAEAHLLARRDGVKRRSRWPAEPGICRVAHGIPNRVDRIKGLGNAQVPRVAATAWKLLTED